MILAASISCKSDNNDCVAPDLTTNIVGSWTLTALGQVQGDVEFKADGTLIDPNDVIAGGEVNGMILDQKTYEVISNFIFEATATDGSNYLTFEFNVPSYGCDEINLEVFGLEATMARN